MLNKRQAGIAKRQSEDEVIERAQRRGESAAEPAVLLSERPMGAVHYRIVTLCFLAWIFDFYDLILYSFLLVPIARDLHFSAYDSSLALGVSFLMAAMGGILFGFLGDRFGRKPTIIASVAIYGIGTILCATAGALPELLVYRSFTGLGIGGEWGAGQSLVAETVPPQRRARYAAYVQVGAPLGVMMAAIVGGYLEPRIGWRLVFTVSAIPAFIVAFAVRRWLPESDVWLRGGGGRHWLGRNDLRALQPYHGILVLLFIVLLVNSEAYWFTYSWMPSYLQLTRGLSQRASSRLMVGMQVGAIAGYVCFGAFADRWGRRPVFSAYAAMMALGLLPPTVLWRWALTVPGLIAAAMVLAGFGTGLWAGAAPIISEMLPTKVRNTSLGLLLNATRGIQFFTPLMITFLSTYLGFGATLSIGALFSAAGALIVWALPETRGRVITALDSN